MCLLFDMNHKMPVTLDHHTKDLASKMSDINKCFGEGTHKAGWQGGV